VSASVVCPVCQRTVALTPAGRLAQHDLAGARVRVRTPRRLVCRGSGKIPGRPA
jgi:hypothetical protein